ncbi:ketohydroxyglutarate aldolase [Nonlabens sp. YIK11]|uniref:ketohydroxyglutarate aldolase n=1 Tax=Nonlabens sp. YIK11 TaxID=1453349 RepID=UPI0006DC4FD1|nr:ketohydroxyglutarate aldolase [Nonlabens sp. YIK11]KQC33808.1 ketohydroxyglutarate aldolase [Nonlabens sp. YIK11]
MNIETFISRTDQHTIVPVFYHGDLQTCIDVVNAAYDGGVRTFEFVDRGANAIDTFKELMNRKSRWPDLEIGIGTIYDLQTAKEYINLGAAFVVSPCLVDEVAIHCRDHDVSYIPGIATIKEAFDASTLGCKMIKIFPANVIGSAFAKAITSVLPQLAIMPTGGIEPTANGLKEWFDAGVNCVGMGSQLFDKNKISKKDYVGLSNDIVEAINNANLVK